MSLIRKREMTKIFTFIGFVLGLLILAGGVSAVFVWDGTSCAPIFSSGYYAITADITDGSASPACIEITASDVILDGQGFTITGWTGAYGVYAHGSFGSHLTNVTVKNVTVTGWAVGIDYLYVDNSTGSIRDNTANSNNQYGIYLFSSNNNTVANNIASNNSQYGIVLDSSSNNTIANNNVTLNGGFFGGGGPATYYISQLENGVWNPIYAHHFETRYTTEEFDITVPEDREVRLRIIQKDVAFGDVDEAKLSACGEEISLNSAVYTESGESVLEDIGSLDNNVVIAHEKEIELGWMVPETCDQDAIFSLTANEYYPGFPIQFPRRGIATYSMGSNQGAITVDGLISEVDGIETALYSPYWQPTSGHPKGYTYIYVSDDDSYVYFSFDLTSDNTDEFGEDWLEISIEDQKFRVDDNDDTWGKCGFGLTSKVSYKHQTCEMRIPKNLVGTDDFDFTLEYYGTLASTYAGIWLYGSDNNDMDNNVVTSNSQAGIYLQSSDNNVISGGSISDNTDIGVYIEGSNYVTVTGVEIKNNSNQGIYDTTFGGEFSYQNFANNNISGSNFGIYMESEDNSNVTGNRIWNNTRGIYNSWSGGGNTFSSNTLYNNTYGYYFSSSSGDTISGGSVTNNTNSGIYLRSSSNNAITGVAVTYNNKGLDLDYPENNTVTGNTVTGNTQGILLTPIGTPNPSTPDKIYNNRFNNTNNAGFGGAIYTNIWNTTKTLLTNIIGGLNLGGNFWATPTGTGFSETCTDADRDGICDTNYTLASGNVDYLPLTVDTTPPSITFVSPTPANGATVVQNWAYINVTADETLSTAILEWNGINETMNPGSWYVNKTGLTYGIYTYRVFGNDSVGNWNVSETRTVTIHASVVVIPTATGLGNATLTTSSGGFSYAVAVNISDLPDLGKPNGTFPYGFFRFNITGLTPGQNVTITITLPSYLLTNTAEYWKYSATSGWYQIPLGSNDGDNIITITLTDGGLGDDDGTENGVISDDGGPVVPFASVPGLTPIGIAALASLGGLIGIRRTQKKRGR